MGGRPCLARAAFQPSIRKYAPRSVTVTDVCSASVNSASCNGSGILAWTTRRLIPPLGVRPVLPSNRVSDMSPCWLILNMRGRRHAHHDQSKSADTAERFDPIGLHISEGLKTGPM